MIFQYTLDAVLEGRKNQTRRVIKSGETAVRGRHNVIDAVTLQGRDKWRVGQTYAVQPSRGKSQVARIVLKSIRSEALKRVSTNDAIAEGFASRQEFLQTWRTIHGADALEVRVWVLTFEVVAYTYPHPTYAFEQIKSSDFHTITREKVSAD